MQFDQSKYLILGDSQTTALLMGVIELGRPDLLDGGSLGAGMRFNAPFFTINDDMLRLDPERTLCNKWFSRVGVKSLDECKGKLIVSLGLSAYQFYANAMWRSFGGDKKFISDSLIEQMIMDQQQYILQFYTYLIQKNLIKAAYAAPNPARNARCLSFRDKAFVFDLLSRYIQPVEELLGAHNIPVIRLPVEDEDGFLKEEFVGVNAGHANAKIGPMAVTALEKL